MDVVVLSQPPTGVTVDIYSGFSSSITASNLGAGSGIFSSMSGTTLQFKSLVQGSGITLTSDSNTITLTVDDTYINGLITTAITGGLNLGTANRAVVTNGSGILTASAITAAQIGYLSDVGSNIGALIGAKQDIITGGASTIVSSNLANDFALVSNGSGKVAVLNTVSSTKLGYLADVTGLIQAQLNDLDARILTTTISGVPDLRYKVLSIGAWNMDSTASVSLAHGITSGRANIVSVKVKISTDSGASYIDFESHVDAGVAGGGGITWSDTTLGLERLASGIFDSTTYDDAAMNRGEIFIIYKAY